MNLRDLKSNVEVLVPDFPTSLYVSTVVSWLNQAQREVAGKMLVTGRASTKSEAGTSEYELPDNYIMMKRDGVKFNGKVVQAVSESELSGIYPDGYLSLESGDPKHCLIREDGIQMIPAPSESDVDINLEYWAYPNDLSIDDDIPFTTGDADSGYSNNNRLRVIDGLLVTYAVGMAKYSIGFYSTTESALKDFYALLASKAETLKRKPEFERNIKRPDPMRLRMAQTRMNNG